jgi:hypothetical protein
MKIRVFKLGATGQFPQGKAAPDDEGELQLGVTHREGNVEIHFGKPIAWLAFPPEKALEFARIIMEHAHQAQGGRTQ